MHVVSHSSRVMGHIADSTRTFSKQGLSSKTQGKYKALPGGLRRCLDDLPKTGWLVLGQGHTCFVNTVFLISVSNGKSILYAWKDYKAAEIWWGLFLRTVIIPDHLLLFCTAAARLLTNVANTGKEKILKHVWLLLLEHILTLKMFKKYMTFILSKVIAVTHKTACIVQNLEGTFQGLT